MPQVYEILGYHVYFWSNEAGECVHFHITKGCPHHNDTKFWVTSTGDVLLAHNKGGISKNDLRKLLPRLRANSYLVVRDWLHYHGQCCYYV